MGKRPGWAGLAPVWLAVLVVLAAVALPGTARAVLELDITSGNPQPVAIAIPAFEDDVRRGNQLGRQISDVITGDLVSSGLFKSMNRAAFIAKRTDFNRPPRFGDWRLINAQALLTGRVSSLGDGRLKAEFRLWDVYAGKQLAGQQFFTRPENWRQLAHVIADTVYQRITGESGYFDTQIVFVHESGPKDARVKRLAIMDQDGHNVRMLTQGRSLVLTPRFSPTRQEITYMSYEAGRPRVYLLNLETREKEIIGDFRGMSFSPRFSPDGHKIIMSLTHNGYSNIYTMDLRSRRTKRLTNTQAIDTAPCYSPDGRSIVFESDRSGSQQIYVMNADGSNQRRISFGEGSYSTPVWSPRGDLIAFTKRLRGRFLIGVMRTDGSGERILTEGYHNEGPTWAPNGRVLMFFRETPGPKGGPRLFTIDLTGYNERRIATPSFGSDPAWSPLID